MDEFREDRIYELAEILGRPADEIRKLMATAEANAKHEALESLSDNDIPGAVVALVTLAEMATGQAVRAIKRTTWTTHDPESPASDGWQFRRLSYTLQPDDPPAVKNKHDGFALITDGNPIMLESWFEAQGLTAIADQPTVCRMEMPDAATD